jgi:dihydrofolate synthase/folylpolyglutamate synthase
VSFAERIQVNRQPIPPEQLVPLVESVRGWLANPLWTDRDRDPASRHGRHAKHKLSYPTFFEVVTVMALRYFADQQCDLVIWETGMGGRLDATNIVQPIASVITNIQFDHQRWLGSSLAEIAREKAGIIKRHTPVITATEDAEALEVIQTEAAHGQAPVTVVTSRDLLAAPLTNLTVPLLGDHQRLNAAVALATVKVCQPILPVDDHALRTGVQTVQWHGRLQTLERGDQLYLLDGAHNPAGIATLMAALEKYFPGRRLSLIFGVLRDKDWPAMCQLLVPGFSRIYLVPVESERSAFPEEIKSVIAQRDPRVGVQVCVSLREALAYAARDRMIVIAGSLYLIGEALELLAPEDSGPSEPQLNEWTMPQRGL